MKLEDKRVYLTPLSYKELSGNYMNWFNNKDVCKYNSHGNVEYTYDNAINFINSLANDDSKKVYAVYTKSEKMHIGNISLQNIDRKNSNAEVALIFGEMQFWNKGFATESLIVLIEKAENFGLHRLYFGTHIENTAMQKLGEKVGFLKEGILKDAQFKNGKFNDIVIYGLILEKNNEVL